MNKKSEKITLLVLFLGVFSLANFTSCDKNKKSETEKKQIVLDVQEKNKELRLVPASKYKKVTITTDRLGDKEKSVTLYNQYGLDTANYLVLEDDEYLLERKVYDDEMILKKHQLFNLDGKLYEEIKFAYDSTGKIKSKMDVREFDTIVYTYKYRERGDYELCLITENRRSGFVFKKFIDITLNGSLKEHREYFSTGSEDKLISRETYNYKNGLVSSDTMFRGDDTLRIRNYEYDNYGNETKSITIIFENKMSSLLGIDKKNDTIIKMRIYKYRNDEFVERITEINGNKAVTEFREVEFLQ